MKRIVGTTVRGLRTPIFQEGDDLSVMIPDVIEQFLEQEHVTIGTKDVVAMTESIVARAQGNYVSIDTVAADFSEKFGEVSLGVIFPILSRNRFAVILRAIALSSVKNIILMLSYPSDEVGNHLISLDMLDEAGVNPYSDVLSEDDFRKLFGYQKHRFTGIDYIDYYKELVAEYGKECRIVFSNRTETILDYTDHILNCDIHTRQRTKRRLLERGAKVVYSLDDIMTTPRGSGYNREYGLLGSNKATEDSLKLFPRDSMELVDKIQQELRRRTGQTIEVMVYGDGAFKDPVGKIWELADPVVSPGFTAGLAGTPNEIKLKYVADNQFRHLHGQELSDAIKDYMTHQAHEEIDSMAGQGTTPRQLTDLIGSLADLTSGSGDKGTPLIYIQGYFDKFTTEE
ncbi:MAG TPA: F420-0--gamma-glutamyl ligase [Tissierellia bacterium]|nr:F420-0--gamma-glutamyl ligase [Tissierellia bacterium]